MIKGNSTKKDDAFVTFNIPIGIQKYLVPLSILLTAVMVIVSLVISIE